MTPTEDNPVCRKCGGSCCARFALKVNVDARGLPDWDAQLERDRKTMEGKLSEAYLQEVAFMKANFVPLAHQQRDLLQSFEGAGIPCGQNRRMLLWFGCRQFKGGRCQSYEQRPQACRTYLCQSLAYRGVHPFIDIRWDGRAGEVPKLGFVTYFPGVLALMDGTEAPGEYPQEIKFDGPTADEERDEYLRRLPQILARGLAHEGVTPEEFIEGIEVREKAREEANRVTCGHVCEELKELLDDPQKMEELRKEIQEAACPTT